MIIPWQNLSNLPVETKSGQSLGMIVGVDIDSETFEVKLFHVKSRGLIKGLLNNELMIAKEQVISIDNERMVVFDAVVREKKTAGKKIARVVPESGMSGPMQSSQN